MDLQLKDRHVLVTGGSRGIGFACVRGFLAEGARVSLVSRQAQSVQAALERLRADGHSCVGQAADLTDPQAALAVLDAIEAQAGHVDVLVNCAGAARQMPFAELTPQAWHTAMDAKFFAYVHVMDPAAKRMAERGGGAIVNVVGMGGKLASTAHIAGGSANAALMLATAGMALAWAPKGVRINAVNPGLTLTDRLNDLLAVQARVQGKPVDDVLAAATAKAPLGRLARPEEIADAVVYLASGRASYVAGAILSLDGAATPTVV